MQPSPWWRGRRGEWYVVLQFILLGLVVVTPWRTARLDWPVAWSWLAQSAGALLLLVGAALAAVGLLGLGRNLSPLPHPKPDAALVETGIYGLMRHPIYTGLIAGSLGWALLHQSRWSLLLAAAVFLFFDLKARREERALRAHFPAYARYAQRVRRFIPFIY